MTLEHPTYLLRTPVDDVDLSQLHRAAFASEHLEVLPWGRLLAAHSLTWVQAVDAGRLIGASLLAEGFDFHIAMGFSYGPTAGVARGLRL